MGSLVGLAASSAAVAEEAPSIGGFQPHLPPVTIEPPQPEAVAPFIESLSENQALIEVIVGQGRLITTKQDIAFENQVSMIAIGDPTILDFEVVGPQQIRVTGLRMGTTDLSVSTTDGPAYSFEIQVVADLDVLRGRLREVFPGASLRLKQIRDHIVVEGQARSAREVSAILQMIGAYLGSVQVPNSVAGPQAAGPTRPGGEPIPYGGPQAPVGSNAGGQASGNGRDTAGNQFVPDGAPRPSTNVTYEPPQIINLIRVPGPQQVLLKVRIAELNRTAMREVGADLLTVDPSTGNIFGTQIGGAVIEGLATLGLGGLTGSATGATSSSTTGVAILPSSDVQLLLRLLRENNLLKIHAEPNLVTMSGHEASFLAGGEFPVPVPQVSGAGTANTITILFKEFGVRLDFVPHVIDDETIRLRVEPEVSTVDFSLGTTLVVGGDPVPGLNARRAQTTVQLKQEQTLAIAGLLQVTVDGMTSRVPGLGDLPYIGPMFSNTSHSRVEKELLVLVTPYLVQPMEPCEVPDLPGSEVYDPNDLEFYFLNRIAGRTGVDFRATTKWDDPCRLRRRHHLERIYMRGPVGYSK